MAKKIYKEQSFSMRNITLDVKVVYACHAKRVGCPPGIEPATSRAQNPRFSGVEGVNCATAALTARESASVLCASYTLVKLVP